MLGKYFPLKSLMGTNTFFLGSILPVYAYDEGNKPTRELQAYKLDLTRDIFFDHIMVKIPLDGIALTPNELKERQARGQRTAVTLQDAVIAMFQDSKTSALIQSCKCSSAKVIDA